MRNRNLSNRAQWRIYLFLLRLGAGLTMATDLAAEPFSNPLTSHGEEIVGRQKAQCPGGNCPRPITAARQVFTNAQRCWENRNLVQADLELQTATQDDALFGPLAPGSFIAPGRWATHGRTRLSCPDGGNAGGFYAFNCFQGAHWRGLRTAADVMLPTGDVHYIFPGITPISIPFNYLIQSPILALNRDAANTMCVNLGAAYDQLVSMGRGENSGPSQICAIRCLTGEMRLMNWILDGSACAQVRTRFQSPDFNGRVTSSCSPSRPLRSAPTVSSAIAPRQEIPQPPATTNTPYCRCRCRMATNLRFLLSHGVSAVHPDQFLSERRIAPNSQGCERLSGGACQGFGWVGLETQPQPVANQAGLIPFPAGWAERDGLLDCTGATPSYDNLTVSRLPLTGHGETEEDFIPTSGGGTIVGPGQIEHRDPQDVAHDRIESPSRTHFPNFTGVCDRRPFTADIRRAGIRFEVDRGRVLFHFPQGHRPPGYETQELPRLGRRIDIRHFAVEQVGDQQMAAYALGSDGYVHWILQDQSHPPFRSSTGAEIWAPFTGEFPESWRRVGREADPPRLTQLVVTKAHDPWSHGFTYLAGLGVDGNLWVCRLNSHTEWNHPELYPDAETGGQWRNLGQPPGGWGSDPLVLGVRRGGEGQGGRLSLIVGNGTRSFSTIRDDGNPRPDWTPLQSSNLIPEDRWQNMYANRDARQPSVTITATGLAASNCGDQ